MILVCFQNEVEVPLDVRTLEDFRRWSHSADFPERGRIDFLPGRIEVDTSPEDLDTHGTLKFEIARIIGNVVAEDAIGKAFVDSSRFVNTAVGLSVEPDVLLVTYDSIRAKRCTLVSRRGNAEGTIEIEGSADLVVEVISDSSVRKDMKLLLSAYYAAGVREYWLADGRSGRAWLQIHRAGEHAFEPAAIDENGYQRSEVLGRLFKLQRATDPVGHPTFSLLSSDPS